VDLDETGAEINQPGLRHPGTGVEGQLDVSVVGEASIGHLDHDQGVLCLRNPATDPLPVENEVRVVLDSDSIWLAAGKNTSPRLQDSRPASLT
jgi:hypothetical protein